MEPTFQFVWVVSGIFSDANVATNESPNILHETDGISRRMQWHQSSGDQLLLNIVFSNIRLMLHIDFVKFVYFGLSYCTRGLYLIACVEPREFSLSNRGHRSVSSVAVCFRMYCLIAEPQYIQYSSHVWPEIRVFYPNFCKDIVKCGFWIRGLTHPGFALRTSSI